MVNKPNSNEARLKRHARVRNKVNGTALRPRLSVFRSEKHIYAQVIDDVAGVTLVAASTLDKDYEGTTANKEAARAIGVAIAKRALEKGITDVVFDRSGYIYHGRIKELAEGAREGGLNF